MYIDTCWARVGGPPTTAASAAAGERVVGEPALTDGAARDAEEVVVRGGVARRGYTTRRAEKCQRYFRDICLH